MNTDEVYYNAWPRVKNIKGRRVYYFDRVTIVTYPTYPADGSFRIGIVSCNPKDLYVKKIGREFASRKAEESKSITLIDLLDAFEKNNIIMECDAFGYFFSSLVISLKSQDAGKEL